MTQYNSAAFIFIFLAAVSSFSILGLGNAFGLGGGIQPVEPREPLNIEPDSERISQPPENITYYEDKDLDSRYRDTPITGWLYNSTEAEGSGDGLLVYEVGDVDNITITTYGEDGTSPQISYCVENVDNTNYNCPTYKSVGSLFTSGEETAQISLEGTTQGDNLKVRWNQDIFSAPERSWLVQISSGSFQAGTFDYALGAFTGLFAIATSNPIIGLFMAALLVVAALIIRQQFRV